MQTFPKAVFRSLLLGLIALSFAPLALAQPAPEDLEAKVDELIGIPADDYRPGSAVLVVKDGEVLLNKGYGLANLPHRVPVTPTTVFDLASVSKQFAGFAIAKLVVDGQIDLKDDIRKYIPELPDFGSTITIDHLVHHTSGVRDWTNTLHLAGWSFDDVISFEQILNMAYRQEKLNFTPGAEYSYSNTGYNLLAELVQRVSGLSFREWTDQHIFQPLGMTDTRFLDDHTEVVPRRASGYYRAQDGNYHASPNNLMALGSSSLFSTTTDLAYWVMHLANPKPEMKAIVERMMQTSPLNDGKPNNYAFGLSVGSFRTTPSVNHSGSWASFRTYLLVLPEENLSVVVLNNYSSNPGATARTIASWFVEAPEETPEEEKAVLPDPPQLSAADLDRYTGTYRLGPGWYVTLTRQGKQLWTQATNESNFPMTLLAKDLFRIDAYSGRTMEFFAGAEGKIIHLVYSGMECPKMEQPLGAEDKALDEYTGRYVSRELLTEYEVMLDGDQLKLRHHRLGELGLSPAYGDDFVGSQWFISSVEFYRDEDGTVQGFRVTSGRARLQDFRKTSR
ncbi:serine hydrolase [Flavilitoribacter nigricans]|uniref:Beta-lactamase-related domain-containing protein n=1 Tax=Flavilitoribacter nigricans (strain ATCC 23147 / DSM 23189 / NBRC 102662 / NCIMB 1420 / SS-2) TaxID=1122177 RepID=A0A2D0NJW1_FLAN2|nr:serine hydrolase [Flavilitoribacter nigricans]PHN08656.1 hypothetical protein CRP01_01725 [Flavilitoribacter nigricans DSM 23189 = NBRC 102662]